MNTVILIAAMLSLTACSGFNGLSNGGSADGSADAGKRLQTAAMGSASGAEPTLADLFAGRASFQQIASSQEVTFDFKGLNVGVYDEKVSTLENPADGAVYAFVRGDVSGGRYKIFFMKSTDGGLRFTVVTPLFANLGADWTLYDPHVTVDASVTPARYLMAMECANSTFGASVCISQTRTPFDPASWSTPRLLVQNRDAKSASTGAILADGGRFYVKWTMVDDGAGAGRYASSTWARAIGLDDPSNFSDVGTQILAAENDSHCESSWDCNNQDTQDWKREGDYYYMIYNGANYYRCTREAGDPGSSEWALAIRRSRQPLGSYEESSGKLIEAPLKDTCGISYPVLNRIGGVPYLYYAYYVSRTVNRTMRARLVWNDQAQPIDAMYARILNRKSDAVGLKGAVDMLNGAGSVHQVRRALAYSSEAAGLINGMYQDILKRPVDPVGLARFQSELMGDRTWTQMRAEIRNSPEGRALGVAGTPNVSTTPSPLDARIRSYYTGLLGRAGSAQDVANWAARGLDAKSLAQGFLFSGEFQARWAALGTDQKIDVLYLGLLGRTADPTGRSGLRAMIDSGQSFETVTNVILDSNEFRMRR